MRKKLFIALTIMIMLFGTTGLKAQSCIGDATLIVKAKVAARSCLLPYKYNYSGISASVQTVSACFYQGFIKKVEFYVQVYCITTPCPPIRVATVYFGCNGEVTQVSCD